MTDKKTKQPFYLIDTSADFYRPLGVRLAICISAAGWAALEIWHKEGFWGVISGAVAVYCVYVLFVTYSPSPKQEHLRPTDDVASEEAVSGGDVPWTDEGTEALVLRLFRENATWPELIKAIRQSAQTDIFSAEKIALSHAGWRRRCNVLMNEDRKCAKQAAYHIKAHGALSLIKFVGGRYVVIEQVEPLREDS